LRPSDDIVQEVIRSLERAYGRPTKPPLGDVLEALILTILSQNTSDTNRDRAFAGLKAAFPTWDEALAAGVQGVEQAIRTGGLAHAKAVRIISLLEDLKAANGGVTLEWLRVLSAEDAERVLMAIPGVGKKTARCVLLFELGHPAFPVDTHVLRVAKRLGWVSERTTADRAHDILAGMIPPDSMQALHINMIHLGRTVCRPGRPDCGSCPLRLHCRYADGKRS
jgi:endonuclease-3